MLGMLSGEQDGDALFFARTIVIEGDTAVVVALRNAIDSVALDLPAEIAALCGPFRKPASLGIRSGLFLTELMTGIFSSMRPAATRS